jgi:EAL domain-containing protein (putative c-di-GMP-specific phosphodiesterase class I)/ActR/RegA family two-component response regulator
VTLDNRRLLAIDDEDGLLAVVRAVGADAGYDVVTTTDAGVFIEKTREWQPTLVFMDLQMPDVDGVELLRRLAANNVSAPIVLMSGVEDKVLRTIGDLGADLGLNMRGVLPKPVRLETFRRTLEQHAAPTTAQRHDDLRKAIESDQLTLYYQPIVKLATREAIAVEALVRWQHPTDGLVLPDLFVPLAEECGLIDDLTRCVLRTAVAQSARWAAAGIVLPIAVNLSALNLNDDGFPDRLTALCREHGVDPQQIWLELTETATAHDPRGLKASLSRLRLKGFRLAIDDFGIGYSSMMQLRSLPFSELKIDKSFVGDMLRSEDAGIIVDAILALAGAFRMDVVAEGIETEAQLAALVKRGTVTGQGYLFSRPAPADEIARRFGGTPR